MTDPRSCAYCGTTFTPFAPHHRYCTSTCRRRAKGSSSDRGYGPAHRREKDRWQQVIDDRGAECTMPRCFEDSRLIPRGTPSDQWDLNHTDDRDGYTGPAHMHCNRKARRNVGQQAPPVLVEPTGRWEL